MKLDQMQIRRLGVKYFSAISISFGVIILASGILLLVLPKYRNIDQVFKKENEQRDWDLKSLDINYSALNKYLDEYNSLSKEDIARLDEMLAVGKPLEEIISYFNSFATNDQIKITSIKISPDIKRFVFRKNAPVSGADVGEIAVDLEVAGVDYGSAKSIIRIFENNLRLMDVNKISFSPDDKKLSLNIVTYYLK